ncbi:hypothetical protein [Pedobacter arcticus]|uniref:hypothetical protein n=1 Tax=Pedobacter arcticus TaxID=752140 RepID=UPI0002D589DE|nr:hypothetical protein [Pedobacter arcticus]
MKKINFGKAFMIGLFTLISSAGYSQVAAWQFSLPEPSKGQDVTAKATTIDPNLEQSVLTRGAAADPKKQGNTRGFSATFPVNTTKEESKKSNAYYQFTVQAKKGFKVSLTSIDAVLRRQLQSPYVYRWMYSLDGQDFTEIGKADITVEDLNNNGAKQPSVSLAQYKELQDVSSSKIITIRIYTWGATANTGDQRSFGFGKSNMKGSNVLAVKGLVSPVN